MGIQELEKIAEIISGMGEQALDGLIYWLVASYSLEVLWALIMCGAILAIYKLIRFGIQQSSADTRLRLIRDKLSVGRGGYVTDGEYSQVITKIDELLRK